MLGLIAVFTGAWVLALVLAAAAIGGYFYLGKLGQQQMADSSAANNLANPQAALQSLSGVPPQPNFSLKLSSEAVAPPPTPGRPPRIVSRQPIFGWPWPISTNGWRLSFRWSNR